MTYPTSAIMTFTVPLSYKAHQLAQKVYQKADQAKQVYLNVLASYATDYYLSCLGFATDLENSLSQDPVHQVLSNTGALTVGTNQVLECRPVLPNSDTCHIPLELHQERRGYVAVALNQELTEATILGFYPKVFQEEMPLSQLEDLDALIEYLHIPVVAAAAAVSHLQNPNQSSIIRLSHWLENTIEIGWEAIDRLLPPSPQFAFRSRTAAQTPTVECGKTINLEGLEETIALIIGINPLEATEIEINVEVIPANGYATLPDNVTVAVLDATGKVVMEAVTQTTHKLALDFSGEPGEQFAVKVAYGEAEVTEVFMI